MELTIGDKTIDKTKILGTGMFGKVYQATNTSTGEILAVKSTSAKDEIRILQTIGKHPNIIDMDEHREHGGDVWIFLELCDIGDIQTFCETRQCDVTVDMVIHVVMECCKGLKYLHTRSPPIIHRDIKPGNILLKSGLQNYVVKIADFGLAKVGTIDTKSNMWNLQSNLGTFLYKAPEFWMLPISYTVSVDIFALGLVLDALIHFEQGIIDKLYPAIALRKEDDHFTPIGQVMQHMKKTVLIVKELEDDTKQHKICKNLITKMTQYLPGDRIGLTDVIRQIKKPERGCNDVVIAIDYGTAASGYAYAFPDKPYDVHINPPWITRQIRTNKTPTCVLMNDEHKCMAFGYDAFDKYTQLLGGNESASDNDSSSCTSDDTNFDGEQSDSDTNQSHGAQASGFHLFKSFKMELHSEESWDHNVNLTSEDGKIEIRAIDIFSEALRYLKTHAVESINQARPRYLEANGIKWVLTVPAIWSEGSKKFMRKAAKQAGLIDDIDSNSLDIALEPEAAAYYCRTVPIMQSTSGKDGHMNLAAGCKYMVIDCGGGTVDVTVHVVKDDGSVAELHAANGGPWGSTFIDLSFEKLMKDIFTVSREHASKNEPFIDYFKSNNPTEWLEMIEGFENSKCAWKSGKNEMELSLPFSGQFLDEFSTYCQGQIEISELVKSSKWKGKLKYSKKRLKIKREIIEEKLLNPTIDRIIHHLESLLMKPKMSLKGLSHLFLVGGFGCSKILQEKIKEAFGTEYELCYPNEADVAVLKGAVMYSFNPNMISERIARRTIGMQTMHAFDESTHDEAKKIKIGYKYFCKDIFRHLVTKDELVVAGSTESFIVSPTTKKQKNLKVTIYAADNASAKYVTDEGVVPIGEIPITLPNDHLGPDMDVKISVDFGLTEIKITAKDMSSLEGQAGNLEIDYESND